MYHLYTSSVFVFVDYIWNLFYWIYIFLLVNLGHVKRMLTYNLLSISQVEEAIALEFNLQLSVP